jgi:hypothetical protein
VRAATQGEVLPCDTLAPEEVAAAILSTTANIAGGIPTDAASHPAVEPSTTTEDSQAAVNTVHSAANTEDDESIGETSQAQRCEEVAVEEQQSSTAAPATQKTHCHATAADTHDVVGCAPMVEQQQKEYVASSLDIATDAADESTRVVKTDFAGTEGDEKKFCDEMYEIPNDSKDEMNDIIETDWYCVEYGGVIQDYIDTARRLHDVST